MRKILLLSMLSIWSLVPLAALGIVFFASGFVSGHFRFFIGIALTWSITSLVLFFILLQRGQSGAGTSQFLHGLLGLICTLMLGLPAIAFSVIPLVGSQLDYLQSIDSTGTALDLSALEEESSQKASSEPAKPILYIVGMDVSTSFITGISDARIKKVDLAFKIIKGNFPLLLQGEDSLKVYLFAASSADIKTIQGTNEMPDLDLEAEVKKALGGASVRNLDKAQTNLVSFFDQRVCAWAGDLPAKYREVRVILFSDLLHSVSPLLIPRTI